MTQNACFWIETAPAPQTYTDKPLPQKTDVVVIGGGFTGTSAALQLARGGAKVTLLEAEHIGWGASARNGGQALSCLHHTLTQIASHHGHELARDMFLAAASAADTVERIITEEHIECNYERCGSIEAAIKPSHYLALQKELETLRELANYEVQIVPPGQVRSELGTDAYHGLMINPRSGSVQPASFVNGMAAAAARAGADIHEGTRVNSIERVSPSKDGMRFIIKTSRGDIAAKEVLVAANAWAGKLVPQFRQRVFPIDSFIIGTEPLPETLAHELIPHNRVVYDTRKVLAYYRLSQDRRMLWGGEITFNGASPSYNMNALQRGMLNVFPQLAGYKLDYYWNGTLGVTMDENSHAGQVDGIWYSMCYVGHGVTLATYLGEQIANGILGKPSNNPFAELTIPRVPYAQDKPWFTNLGRAWYYLLDQFR